MVVIGAAVVLALGTAEVVLNRLRGPEACVEVWNEGAEPIENLTLTCGGGRVDGPRIAPGDSARLYIGSPEARTLVLRFRQKGNALGTFELPGFSATLLRRDGFKQVLRIRSNEVERYLDDADPATPAGRLLQRFWRYVDDALDPDSLTR